MQPITALERLDPQRFDTAGILKALARSSRQLAELKGLAASIPNQGILINTLGLQEAKDSSEIENIVTTHDELFKDDVLPEAFANPAAKEVLRYRQALRIGFEQVPERNLAVERLLEGEIKSRFASNIVQEKKFSELLGHVITRHQNHSIETAQVMEELIEMARKFREAATRGETLGLSEDEVRFYDALASNESAVLQMTDETLKKISNELTENLRSSLSVDWSQREKARAKLCLMVKRVLRKYKYSPDLADVAVDLVLEQAEALGEEWAE